jgi:transcription elongation factor Elf1
MLILSAVLIYGVYKLWTWKFTCPYCSSQNTFYEPPYDDAYFSLDEMFHCYDCAKKELP